MGKNIEMLKCFYGVMTNNKLEIQKILPDMYAENFYKIDDNYLKEINIDNLILDIDGTLLKVDDINVNEDLIKQIQKLKDKKFNICLMSNNNESRVQPVANILQVKYLANAHKPLRQAFDNALAILDSNKENTAMIGDQMMSDIKGAKEYGIYSILVKPIDKHNNIQTGTSRFLQNIMEKHLKKKTLFDSNKYYKKGRIK